MYCIQFTIFAVGCIAGQAGFHVAGSPSAWQYTQHLVVCSVCVCLHVCTTSLGLVGLLGLWDSDGRLFVHMLISISIHTADTLCLLV